MNLLKLITKSGRQSLAADILKTYLTTDTITKWATDGTNRLLSHIQNKERLETIAINTKRAASLVGSISAAIEDGEVSNEEAAEIQTQVSTIVSSSISQEQINSLIANISSIVP